MPPVASSCAAAPPGIDAAEIADGRETVATRSPSPCDAGDLTSEVVMELELNDALIASGDVHGIVSAVDRAREDKLPKRRVPAPKGDRKSSRLRLRSSGLLSSFTKAKGAVKRTSNGRTSHDDDDDDHEPTSEASGWGGGRRVSSRRSRPSSAISQQSSSFVSQQSSVVSLRSRVTSQASSSLVLDNELDLGEPWNNNGDVPPTLSSVALLESLGDSPTSGELANLAAVRAKECIEECLRADACVLDRERWDAVPQYAKTDLLVGQHLGRGTFSDVFEVIATVDEEEEEAAPALERFREDGAELDVRIERTFSDRVTIDGDGGEDLDAEMDALFDGTPDVAPEAPPSQRRKGRRRTVDDNGAAAGGLRCSVCMGTHGRKRGERRTDKLVLAMKCSKPQTRSDAEQFLIGAEDLVHETAMLASLDHPHIVKLQGRAGGCVGSSFRLSDGYFILLDRLKDTLEDRIARWKKTHDKKAPPSLAQVRTARAIADAVSYLHSKNIAFRDLKPANVGFDASDTLKLFDFGFAIRIDENGEERGLLYDRCGTPRYMAPEVGLQSGHGLPADVYSFGILLWEICSLKVPFGNFKSNDEFHRAVFEKGGRPKPRRQWPRALTGLMAECWSTDPVARPGMSRVESTLGAQARGLAARQEKGGRDNNLWRSSVFRRFSG